MGRRGRSDRRSGQVRARLAAPPRPVGPCTRPFLDLQTQYTGLTS